MLIVRSVLAELGFADPDKEDPLHDLAIAYLVKPSVIAAQGRAFLPEGRTWTPQDTKENYVLVKGEGKKREYLGWVDVLATFSDEEGRQATIGIEVKVNPLNVALIARQIRIYDSIISPGFSQPRQRVVWVVATTYPLTNLESLAVSCAKARHVLLGEEFHCWARQQAQQPDTPPPASLVV